MCVCLQLTLTYRFSYTVNGIETLLVSRSQASSSLSGFSLPAGAGPQETVYLTVYAMDALGAESSSTYAADRTSPLNVSCHRQLFSGPGMASFLGGMTSSRLAGNLQQVRLRVGDSVCSECLPSLLLPCQ